MSIYKPFDHTPKKKEEIASPILYIYIHTYTFRLICCRAILLFSPIFLRLVLYTNFTSRWLPIDGTWRFETRGGFSDTDRCHSGWRNLTAKPLCCTRIIRSPWVYGICHMTAKAEMQWIFHFNSRDFANYISLMCRLDSSWKLSIFK